MYAPNSGPVSVAVAAQEPAPPPAMAAPEPARQDATAPEKEEDDDGGAWETASLYEEILDEVDAFDYSDNGQYGVRVFLDRHRN